VQYAGKLIPFLDQVGLFAVEAAAEIRIDEVTRTSANGNRFLDMTPMNIHRRRRA